MIALHPPGSETRPHLHVAPHLAEVAGPLIAEAIGSCIQRTGRCRLALSGGTAPGSTYAWLAQHLPRHLYGQLRVTWADERHLPVASDKPGDWQGFHPDSNLRLAYETWLAHVPLPAGQVLPMSLGGDLKGEVVRFGRAFLQAFDGAMDVAVLGVGPDGHIASLFPDHPALEVDDVCLALHDSPKPPAERISLTLPVLSRTPVIILLASGDRKGEVLRRAWSGDSSLPLGRLRQGQGVHWVVDAAAGRELVELALDGLGLGQVAPAT